LISGFAFVNIVTLGNEVGTCLKSRHGRYFDIIVVLVFSSLVFFLTGNLVLYGKYDESIKQCLKTITNDSFSSCKVVENNKTNLRYEIIMKNFLFFCVPFTLILHYFHLRKIKILSKLVLTPKYIKAWTPLQWIIAISGVTLISFIVSKQFFHYTTEYSSNISFLYSCYFFGLIFTIALFTLIMKKTHFLHLHHYFLAMVFMPFFSVQDEVNLVFLALIFGLMIEGASKWGIDPVWNRKKQHLTEAM